MSNRTAQLISDLATDVMPLSEEQKHEVVNDLCSMLGIDRHPQPTAQGVDAHKSENVSGKQSCESKVSDKAAQGVEEWIDDLEDAAIGYVTGAPDDAKELARTAAKNLRAFLSSPPLEDGVVRVPVEPSRGLLVSMAMRNDHGFGLLGANYQNSILEGMKQIHEEVVGTGFYKPERESEYLETLKAASKGER